MLSNRLVRGWIVFAVIWIAGFYVWQSDKFNLLVRFEMRVRECVSEADPNEDVKFEKARCYYKMEKLLLPYVQSREEFSSFRKDFYSRGWKIMFGVPLFVLAALLGANWIKRGKQ